MRELTFELVLAVLRVGAEVRYRVRTGAPTARGASRADVWLSEVPVLEVGVPVRLVGFTRVEPIPRDVVLGTV